MSADIEVTAIVTGRLPMPEAYAHRPSSGPRLAHLAGVLVRPGEMLRATCVAYAIRHPVAGTILVDTGFHPDAHRSVRSDFGTAMGIMFRHLKPAASFDDQLRGLGIDPAAVELVVMTHLHVDHTSAMRLLPRARFAISTREWAAATRPGGSRAGYVRHHLPGEDRVEPIDFGARGEPHGAFSSTIDLQGDGSIRLVSTPGHTPGHMSVLVRPATGPAVLIVGDAAYTRQNVSEELLPLLTAGDDQALASLREINAFARAEPGAIVVPSHDPDAWRALPNA